MAKRPEIPEYKIEATLGRGGMAVVYKARHVRLDRLVALKVMHGDLATRDQNFSERFLREARIAANLNHPNIAHVYDVNKFDDSHYIAMEYVGGGDLGERVKNFIDFDELVEIIDQIASALDYAHGKGFLHRDIKPANILFRDNGDALVADFGIAKAMSSNTQMTGVGEVLGTPVYMSPEQSRGKDIDARSDLYSVAVLTFQILTGQPPYKADTSLAVAIKHISDPIPSLPEPLKEVQPFIDKGMAKDRDQRFSSGAELVAELKRCLARIKPDDLDATRTMIISNLAEAASTAAIGSIDSGHSGARSHPTGGKTITIPVPQITPKIGITAGLLVLLVIVGWWAMPGRVSLADKARIDMLLNAAQADITAGHYYQPEGGNALQKYRQALEIAPDYPATNEALQYLGGLLLQQSENAEQNKDWDRASAMAEQALLIIPDRSSAERQLANIAESQRQLLAQQQRQLDEARTTAAEQRWLEAIEQYGAIPTNMLESAEVQSELSKLSLALIAHSETQTAKQQFSEAAQLLTHAAAFATMVKEPTTNDAVKKAQAANRHQQNSRDQNKQLAKLLQQAGASKDTLQATSLYQQALAISPGNKQATSGMRKHSSALLSSTANWISLGDLKRAQRYLATADKLRAAGALNGGQLQQLNKLSVDFKVAKGQRADLDQLFDRFRRYMEVPKVKSANKIYRRILNMTTTDQRLPRLRQQLADGYLGLANKEAGNRDWKDALTWCERGLEIVPNHAGLTAMQEKATENLPNSRKKVLGIF
ncbi:MAG: protein kinase domain-containing protein [Pseudomonadales bacterium]